MSENCLWFWILVAILASGIHQVVTEHQVPLRLCSPEIDFVGLQITEEPHDTIVRLHSSEQQGYVLSAENDTSPFLCPTGYKPTDVAYGVEETPVGNFNLKGYLGILKCNSQSSKKVLEWYKPGEYCLHVKNKTDEDGPYLEIKSITYCEPEVRDDVVVVQKCCAAGYVLTLKDTSYSCTDEGGSDWHPTIYDSSTVNEDKCVLPKTTDYTARFQTRHTRNTGQKQWQPRGKSYLEYNLTIPAVRWRLLDNGSRVEVHEDATGNKIWEVQDYYCVDELRYEVNQGTFKRLEVSVMLYDEVSDDFCECECSNWAPKFETLEKDNSSKHNNGSEIGESPGSGPMKYWIVVSVFVAVVPLLLTMLAYWLTWSSQNLHGWTVFSHILSLVLLNLSIGTAWLLGYVDTGSMEKTWLKVIIGVIWHFFYLATFMWLTMINFDLWWTFRKLKSIRVDRGVTSYVMFSLISWGVPLLFIVIGLVLDNKYSDKDSDCILDPPVPIPDYGATKYGLQKNAEGAYIYYPLLVLLILNCVFFISTVSKIYSPRCQRRGVLHKKTGLDKHSVELFLKLFVVMGLTFVFEFVSWAFSTDGALSEFFLVMDIFNILGRAVFIFIIFACKPQVLAKVRRLSLQKGVGRQSTSGKFGTEDTCDTSRMKMRRLDPTSEAV